MRSHLVDGKLVEPVSATAAELRQQQLEHEVAGIDKRLADPAEEKRFASRGEYATWRARARGNVRWLREELRQLGEWLARHRADGCENDCVHCAASRLVSCKTCGKQVREGDSWGDGDIGDDTIPSYCSRECYKGLPPAGDAEIAAAERFWTE